MSAAQDFHTLAVMALADGKLAPQEQELLLRCAERLELSRPEAAWILSRVIRDRSATPVKLPDAESERQRLFHGLVNVAVADGVVHPEEERCLQQLAPAFGIGPERVHRILRAAVGTAPASQPLPAGWASQPPSAYGGERLRPGSSVGGKFVLKELLGVGGFGRVFRAHHAELGEDVALKILRLRAEPDALAEERFRNEVRAARSFVHRYAVPLREFGRDAESGCLYFTMDLVEGFSLDVVLDRERRLEPTRAVQLCLQALEALAEAHQQGLVHRDLKPANMMLKKTLAGEEVRLVDFGIARAVHFAESSEETLDAEGSEPLGTLGYMSPEQARRERLDLRSDLYSMGVVLYELLSGRLPIVADPNTLDVRGSFLERLLDWTPAPLEDHVPAPIRQVIDVALQKDPEARFQSAEQLHEALSEAVAPKQDTQRYKGWLKRFLRL